MEYGEQADARRATQHKRRAPRPTVEVVMTFDSRGELEDKADSDPLCLTLEVTNAQRELASWFDNEWWSEVINRCGDRTVTVHIAPTAGASFHPVVLHSMLMLRRVMPEWRLIAHLDPSKPMEQHELVELAQSPYHEIRFGATSRNGSPYKEADAEVIGTENLFRRIREVQQRKGLTMPILVRLPAADLPGTKTHDPSRETLGRPGHSDRTFPINRSNRVDIAS